MRQGLNPWLQVDLPTALPVRLTDKLIQRVRMNTALFMIVREWECKYLAFRKRSNVSKPVRDIVRFSSKCSFANQMKPCRIFVHSQNNTYATVAPCRNEVPDLRSP